MSMRIGYLAISYTRFIDPNPVADAPRYEKTSARFN